MNNFNPMNSLRAMRETFVEALNKECHETIGGSVENCLSSLEINRLFILYKAQNEPAEAFAKRQLHRRTRALRSQQ